MKGLRIVCVVAVATSLTSCWADRPAAVGAPFGSPEAWPEGLSLVLWAVRDSATWAGPVEIAYAVRNSGVAQRVRNDPQLLRLTVRDPHGTIHQEEFLGEVPNLGDRPDLMLPRYGMLVQFVNLACGQWAYLTPSDSGCAFRFDFLTPGRYDVWAVLERGPTAPSGAATPVWVVRSDTVSIVVSAK